MKTEHRFKRKVRVLAAQKERLVRELRAVQALCRQLQHHRRSRTPQEVNL